MFVLTAVFLLQGASAALQCTVCAPPCPPAYTVNVFNLSDDGSAFIGTSEREVRCYEDAGGTLSNTGTEAYNAVVIRITELLAAHSQRGDTPPPNYPYPVNLSSDNRILSCGYILGDCLSNGWQTCVASLSEDTNAHVGDCSRYGLKVCCNASLSDTTGPVCTNIEIYPPSSVPWTNKNFDVLWSCTDPSGISTYNLEYNVTHTNGSPDTPWTLLYSGSLTQYIAFAPAPTANNHTYYFHVNATDNEGNKGGYSANVSTTFDNEAPNISYVLNDDTVNKRITLASSAWDNVSGIFNHTITCIVTNPPLGQPSSVFVQCRQANPFGGISNQIESGTEPCWTNISYEEGTEINCGIDAKDWAGNTYQIPPGTIYYTSVIDNPLIVFVEHNILISIGETYHARAYVRNLKPVPDNINISLGGTYPSSLIKFLNSSIITYMSPDRRNVSVSLHPYEQRILYIEIVSTDDDKYDMTAFARSENFGIDSDMMTILIVFPAAFTGIELLSAVMLVIASALLYWKIREI